MKQCPKCNRTFPDDNQKFCTIDGGLLVAADQSFDPNATVQSKAGNLGVTQPEAPKEEPASPPDFSATIATSSSAPTVVFPKETGSVGTPTAANLHQQPPPAAAPPPAAPPPPPPAGQSPPPGTPVPRAAPLPQGRTLPAPVAVAPPQKKSKLPLVLGILALLFVLGVGGVVAAFFLIIKPRLDQMKSEQPVVVKPTENENANDSVNNNTNTTSETPKTEEQTANDFVPPPNTTKFTNSAANLDGKLAEHYVDFSFYYPNNWVVDPQAGKAGSSNFAKVERRLNPDFTQENFAVGWYTSKGTVAADEATYPHLVAVLGESLAKNFPEYQKVSEGPTRVNSLDGYEFRFTSVAKGSDKGDIQLWGRVIFLPTGVAGDQTGVTIVMLATSLAPELSGVEDLGEKGQAPVILESFRFGKS